MSVADPERLLYREEIYADPPPPPFGENVKMV